MRNIKIQTVVKSKSQLLGIAILSSFLMITSCHKTEKVEEGDDNAKFVLNDSIARIIKIDTVKSHLLEGSLDLNGEVTFNENAVVRVMPMISGSVEEVKVQLGDYVQQGQTLATIRSGELASLQSELAAANAEQAIAEKNLEVAKDLAQKGINSQRDVLEAEQGMNKAGSETKAIQSKLSIIGGTLSGSQVQIKAPVSGYIVSRKINPNQVVEEGSDEPMFVVSDLKQVWVMANVYEADIAKINTGEDVNIATIAYPNRIFKGKIDYLSNVLDPENKTMKIRIILDNLDNALKPDMFAKVTLTYKDQVEVASIPKDALVFDDSKNYVVVYNGKDNITVRPVDLYPANKGLIYIRSGLKPGERIISKNQLIVYNALTSL